MDLEIRSASINRRCYIRGRANDLYLIQSRDGQNVCDQKVTCELFPDREADGNLTW
jgi:hypothetical protein